MALDVICVLVAHSQLAPYYKGWSTMCLWYAGSTVDMLKKQHGGREEITNPKLWEYGGTVKVLSLRRAVYKPYESTVEQLRAAVAELDAAGEDDDAKKKTTTKHKGKSKDEASSAARLASADIDEVVNNLKSLSEESLVARARKLKADTKEILRLKNEE